MSFTKSQTLFGSHYEFQHSGQPWKHVKTLEKVKYTCIISLQKLLEFTHFTARYKTNWLTQILLWNPSTSTRIHKYTACFIAGWFFNCQNIADYGWQVWQYQSASCAVTSIRKSQHITCTPQKKKNSLRIFPDRKSILMWGGGTNSDTEISHLLVCFKQVLSDHKMVPTIFVEKHEIQNKL